MIHVRRIVFTAVLLLAALPACFAGDDKKSSDVAAPTKKTKVACVGDSITAGYGVSPGNAYPSQLGRMLGARWDVANFGVSASTLLNNGDLPYQRQDAFARALEFKPDIVLIMLGSNDTKPQNWKSIAEFAADYKNLIGKFAALESKPRVFIARPCVVLGPGAFGLTEANLKSELPMIDAIAKENGVGLVDIHGVTEAAALANPALIPDNVHPNAEGSAILSTAFYKAITGKEYSGPSSIVGAAAKTGATQPATK
jgi:lysophospholipase L1-like esterase